MISLQIRTQWEYVVLGQHPEQLIHDGPTFGHCAESFR
jgi:hypothetical protein